jgi:predicted nucleic acid-binding Zn ribbon protein
LCMRRRPASAARPLGEALEELVEKLGIKKKLREYEAVERWEEVVGQQIGRVTRATKITKGVLFVRVRTGTWRNELRMRKQEIIRKINQVLGDEIVVDIRFH